MKSILLRANALFDRIPADVVALALRVFPAMVFFQSGRTKVEGVFSIKDSTFFLFEHEYALPVISHEVAAVLATVAEHALPILLIAGLFSRLSALGLIVMTAVIQIFVYPGAWITHGLWIAALLPILAHGPGRLSLDHLLGFETGSPRADLTPDAVWEQVGPARPGG
ncbi:DoxX family protein [Anianabacter salinae]|uniref:DoxX family protein n=1 Tax=Anianabacter salinae TaxID=2851023 RepID=UPI00225E41F4|nr:DoxX family protein [Anianabacter salinae]MBV0914024.1 DoxX family protein [Anianabacter salinae]